MGYGGAREGAGRKKGGKNAETLSKAEAREVVRQLVMAEMQPMIHAQVAHAKGLQYLVRRDKKTGKFVTVGPDELADIDQDETPLEVWKKEPNVPAFTDLMNRCLDKPKEQEQDIKIDGKLDITVKTPW